MTMNDKSNSQAYSFKLPVLEPIMSTLFGEKRPGVTWERAVLETIYLKVDTNLTRWAPDPVINQVITL